MQPWCAHTALMYAGPCLHGQLPFRAMPPWSMTISGHAMPLQGHFVYGRWSHDAPIDVRCMSDVCQMHVSCVPDACQMRVRCMSDGVVIPPQITPIIRQLCTPYGPSCPPHGGGVVVPQSCTPSDTHLAHYPIPYLTPHLTNELMPHLPPHLTRI